MTTPHRRRALALGIALIVLSVLYATLPLDWIEQRWHVSPDGDSGLVEVLVPLVLGAVGVLLLLPACLSRWRSTRRAGQLRPQRSEGSE